MKKLLFLTGVICITLLSCSKQGAVSNGGNSTGQGGSLARFTIINNYLYTVEGMNLSVFDISNNNAPVFRNKIQVGFTIEAIFPFENKLFLASNNAMTIYSVADPALPAFESHVQHLTGCDPIVADSNVAYLTIHGGNRCGSQINQLQVYNVSNMANPDFVKSINMDNPMGLGMKDDRLFVCDNGTGLRIFDISNRLNPVPLKIISGESFVDVIPNGDLLICMLTNGVAFYNISDPDNIVKLGTVKN
jgi:hypothetical protein